MTLSKHEKLKTEMSALLLKQQRLTQGLQVFHDEALAELTVFATSEMMDEFLAMIDSFEDRAIPGTPLQLIMFNTRKMIETIRSYVEGETELSLQNQQGG